MKPKGLKLKVISDAHGWATNIDENQQSEQHPRVLRGFRRPKQGMVAERRYGTKNRLSSYPTGTMIGGAVLYDSTTHDIVPITSITRSGSTATVTVGIYLFGADFRTGSSVAISGATQTEYNGTFQITLTGLNTFTYTVTGTPATPATGTMTVKINGNTEHEIVVVLDASNNTRIYVETSGTSTPNWIEITEKYTMKVNEGAGIGANDEVTDIDTTTYNGGAITDLTGIDLSGYVVVNTTQSISQKTVTAFTVAATTATVTAVGHGLSAGHIVWLRGFSIPESGGDRIYIDRHFRVAGITDPDNFTITVPATWQTDATLEVGANMIVVPTAAVITSNTATAITTDEQILGSNGYNWLNNDDLVVMRSYTLYQLCHVGSYQNNGTNVHVEFNTITEQRKVNIYLSKIESDGSFTRRDSIAVMYRGSKSYSLVNTSGDHYDFTIPAMWTAERGGGGLIPFYEDAGVVLTTTTGRKFITITDDTADVPMMYFDIQSSANASTGNAFGLCATLVYGGYQESDPIWKTVIKNFSPSAFTARFSPGRINKEITGIRIYGRFFTATETTAEAWNVIGLGDYALLRQISVTEEFLNGSAAGLPDPMMSSGGVFTLGIIPSEVTVVGDVPSIAIPLVNAIARNIKSKLPPQFTGGASTSAALSREADFTRAYNKPRFYTESRDTQGSRVIVDRDDSTLFASAYGGLGTGVHADDCFPDITVDNNGFRQRFDLLSKGELMGLGFANNQAIVFKRNWIEYLDVQSSNISGDPVFKGDDIVKGDVASRKGIVQTPRGMFWMGHNGVYAKLNGQAGIIGDELLPNGDKHPITNIKNFIDGTLLTADGTPYMTATYREAAVGGYDPYMGEVWWNVQVNITSSTTEYVNLCYNIADSSWWVQVLNSNSGRVRWFTQRKDNTLTIGHDSAILKYPNIGSFLDAVASDGTGGVGYQTKIQLNLGFISELTLGAKIFQVSIDCEGESTTGQAFFNMKLYPEGNSYLLDTAGIPIDGKFSDRPIRIERIGKVSSCWLELSLPSGSEATFKKWQISSITVWYTEEMSEAA